VLLEQWLLNKMPAMPVVKITAQYERLISGERFAWVPSSRRSLLCCPN